MNKNNLSETDICDNFITLALEQSGRTVQHHVLRECTLRPVRVVVRGQASTLRADYVLFYKPNLPLAVVEANDSKHFVGRWDAEAMRCAELMDDLRLNARRSGGLRAALG